MEKLKGYSAALISSISYGLIPLFIIPVKQVGFSLNVTLFYRFTLAAAMALVILLFKRESLRITKIEALLLLSLGLDYALSNELLFLGYDLTTPAVASTLLFIYPVIVALIARFIFKEKLKGLTYLALLISLFGVYLLTMGDTVFSVNFPGLTAALGAAFFYAVFILTVNRSNMKLSAWKMSFYSLFFAALYYTVKVGVVGESYALPDVMTLVNFAVFALVTTVISNVGLIYAAQRIGSTPTAIMGALEPVVAVLVSVFLFYEPATWKLTLGVVLIITGVIFNILAGKGRKSKLRDQERRMVRD